MKNYISFCEQHIEYGTFIVRDANLLEQFDMLNEDNSINSECVVNGADIIITSKKNDSNNNNSNNSNENINTRERLFLIHSELLKVWSPPLYNLCTHPSFGEAQNPIILLSTNEDILECIVRFIYTADPLRAIQQSILKQSFNNNYADEENNEIILRENIRQLIRLWNESKTWDLIEMKQVTFEMIQERLNNETWLISDAVEIVRNELRMYLDLIDENEDDHDSIDNNNNNNNNNNDGGVNEMKLLLGKIAQEKMSLGDVKDLVIQRILFMN